MADAHKIYNENLRQKSRTLLERLEKNSQIINREINKLHSQRSFVSSEHQPRVHRYKSEITRSWKIRNDSSGVSGLLCPDIFNTSGRNNINERGDMTVGGRILITSKRPAESLLLRKPIKGCYCNHEPKKILYRSPRTIHKNNWPCDYCKSNFDVRLPSTQNNEHDGSSPTLSCQTLQKVQRINYTPRSEFLRRVQKKVSQHYNICSANRSEPALQTPQLNEKECYDVSRHSDSISNESPHEADYRTCVRENEEPNLPKERRLPKTLRIAEGFRDFTRISNACPCESQTSISARRSEVSRSKSKSREAKIPRKSSFIEQKDITTPEIQTAFPSCMRSKTEISSRKTICSSKQSNNRPTSETSPTPLLKSKKKTRVLSQKRSGCIDCCLVKERTKKTTNATKKLDRNDSKCCCCLSRLCSAFTPQNNSIDREAAELQKFREKNYYDTHGSRQTLLSSPQSSSGSLEQYRINERLFPERIGKIHRDDLVVSMPICATEQLKRIHYFPRHIVKQQKNSVPMASHSKKGRYQSCPLTGHAIDLGALKEPCPANSLALKFQKGVA